MMGDGRQITDSSSTHARVSGLHGIGTYQYIIIKEYSQPSAGRRELLFHVRTILHHDRGS